MKSRKFQFYGKIENMENQFLLLLQVVTAEFSMYNKSFKIVSSPIKPKLYPACSI